MRYCNSELVCPECGRKFPIPRKMSRQREKMHIKDLFCPFCGKVQKMTEIRYNDFTLDRRERWC